MPRFTYVVAIFRQTIVGTAAYFLTKKKIHISQWATHPQWQRRGIATQLVDHLEEIAIQAKVSLMTLWTVEESGNVPIFERLGFKSVEKKVSDIFQSTKGDLIHEVLMVKSIP